MNIKTLALNKPLAITLTTFTALLAIAVTAPLIHHQIITGTIVNAVLFISASLLGWQMAVAIGVLPSLIALLAGTLPLPLALMIPFIIVSNTLLVLSFYLLKNKNVFLGILTSSFLKFIFLASMGQILIHLILKESTNSNLALMMSWPQLVTALLGGLLAFATISLHKKNADRNL
ncbi:MAG: iron hydrogenase [Candidatus Gribaldobacteria bacterium]|nr:iron hydrogenase [Candidatus Gribaldobacteria bacterium]